MQNQIEESSIEAVVRDLTMGVSIVTAVGPNVTDDQLYRCLESVALQEIDCPLEHIVVFDGAKAAQSTLAAFTEIVELYYKKATNKTINPIQIPWSGPGYAKTQGLNVHKYKYVAFMDADDKFYNNKSIISLVKMATVTGVDIVQGVVLLEKGKVLLDPYNTEKYGVPTPVITSKREIFERCQVFKRANVAGKLFNSLVVSMKYNVESDMCDDVYGVVEAMYNTNSVAVIPDNVYVICENAQSVSKASSYTKLLAIRKYAKWAREFAQEHCLILPDKYFRLACIDITIFGKRVLRINKWKYRLQVLLFGKQIFMLNIGL